MKREFDEITPREAAKVRNSPERLAFTHWLRDTLKPGDLVHGFLMSSSTKRAMHEFSHFVDHPECDFCAVAMNSEELVLTTVAYINGERVLSNPYIKWSRINDKSRDMTFRLSGYLDLLEHRRMDAAKEHLLESNRRALDALDRHGRRGLHSRIAEARGPL